MKYVYRVIISSFPYKVNAFEKNLLFGVLKKAEGTEKSLTACPVMWYNTVTVV